MVKRVFVLEDTSPDLDVASRTETMFSFFLRGVTDQTNQQILILTQEDKKNFERQYLVNLIDQEWEVLSDKDIWKDIKEALLFIAEPISQKGIITTKDSLRMAINGSGAVLRYRSNNNEQPIYSAVGVYDISDAKRIININVTEADFGRGPAFDSLIKKLSVACLKPNVFYDIAETEKRIKEVRDKVSPRYHLVRRGQVIVRAGDPITEIQELQLKKLNTLQDDQNIARVCFGYFICDWK